MSVTAQAPCYGFGRGKLTHPKKEELRKIKLWRSKNDKIKKTVKDQEKEITASLKTYNDRSKDILFQNFVVYLKEVKDKRQQTG